MPPFLLWIIVGGLIGLVASVIKHANGQQGLLLNIVVGIAGAFVAGLLLTPLFDVSTINEGNYSLPAIIVSLGGALLLLTIVNTLRRGTVR